MTPAPSLVGLCITLLNSARIEYVVTGGLATFVSLWSPDGKRIAFTAESPTTDAEDVIVQPVDQSAPPIGGALAE